MRVCPTQMAAGLMSSQSPRISVCIITLNEVDRIGDCIESVAFCDEVVVVDSGSTDGTADLAQQRGARVMQRDFDGYRTQKAYAVAQASHDWVLCLDADERVTPALRQSIEAARDAGFGAAAGYRFARLTNYFGGFLRHGNAYPDRVLRLFDRRRGGWRGEREIHESVGVDGEVQTLAGDAEHYPYRSFAEQMHKQEKYADMMAAYQHGKGRRASLVSIAFNPWWRFFRGYVLRAGFLDGWRGFVYALTRLEYVRRKYVKLWLLEHGYKP